MRATQPRALEAGAATWTAAPRRGRPRPWQARANGSAPRPATPAATGVWTPPRPFVPEAGRATAGTKPRAARSSAATRPRRARGHAIQVSRGCRASRFSREAAVGAPPPLRPPPRPGRKRCHADPSLVGRASRGPQALRSGTGARAALSRQRPPVVPRAPGSSASPLARGAPPVSPRRRSHPHSPASPPARPRAQRPPSERRGPSGTAKTAPSA